MPESKPVSRLNLVSRWYQDIAPSIFGLDIGQYMTPENFRTSVRRSVVALRDGMLVEVKKYEQYPNEYPDFRQHILDKYNEKVLDEHTTNPASNLYLRVYKELLGMKDARKQEEWAVSKDHLNTLFYRTLTTLMIAGVILLTGVVAKTFEIPLPLLKIG